MRSKSILAFGAMSALAMTSFGSGAAPLPKDAALALFAPLEGASSVNTWHPSKGRPVILAQGSDAFAPLGFDPSHPEKTTRKPQMAPVWPALPAGPDSAKPLKIEPMKLLQPPKPQNGAGSQPPPRIAPRGGVRPVYPAPQAPPVYPAPQAPPVYPAPQAPAVYPGVAQPGTAYGYGYPRPPAFDWGQRGRNPWALNERNSWMKSGNNSWNNAGRNSWTNSGRNTVTNANRNPWAAPGAAASPPRNNWGRNPYYDQRQPVFAPRYRNPWELEGVPRANNGYNSGFAPLYRRGDNSAKTASKPRSTPGIYPNYNWRAPAPWYGQPPGIR